jgi:transposase
MLPVINEFKNKYHLNQLVVIADAGLLSKENIALLEQGGHEYILGARIKASKSALKEQILALRLKNGESASIILDKSTKMIVNYSDARAKKDAFNRERGLSKLEKQIKSGKLNKSNINNRGYNKFLLLEGAVNVNIDRNKIIADQRWDGLKGYISNTTLSADEVITQYKELWQIEKAFRIAKHELSIRPIYHRKQRRIEAHICIAFVAYKIYKELERQLKEKKSRLSPEKAIDIAKTIYAVKIQHPISKEIIFKTHIKSKEQIDLAKLFGF